MDELVERMRRMGATQEQIDAMLAEDIDVPELEDEELDTRRYLPAVDQAVEFEVP